MQGLWLSKPVCLCVSLCCVVVFRICSKKVLPKLMSWLSNATRCARLRLYVCLHSLFILACSVELLLSLLITCGKRQVHVSVCLVCLLTSEQRLPHVLVHNKLRPLLKNWKLAFATGLFCESGCCSHPFVRSRPRVI